MSFNCIRYAERPVCAENLVRLIWRRNHVTSATMVAALLPFEAVGFAVQTDQPTEAENAALRRQLIVLQRKVRGRIQFTNSNKHSAQFQARVPYLAVISNLPITRR
jgi:hypothetical protein